MTSNISLKDSAIFKAYELLDQNKLFCSFCGKLIVKEDNEFSVFGTLNPKKMEKENLFICSCCKMDFIKVFFEGLEDEAI